MELEDELEERLIPSGVQSQLFIRHQREAVFYRSGPRRRCMAQIQAAVTSKPPVILLLGEAATGKSTLLSLALAELPKATLLEFDDANLSLNGILQTVAHSLNPKGDLPRYQNLAQFQGHLREQQRQGQHLFLAFERGERLDLSVLKALLQSSGSLGGEGALFTLVLMGGTNLSTALLEMVTPFMPVRIIVEPFHAADVSALVQLEIQATGYPENDFFTPQAIQYLAEQSHGLPGMVSEVATLAEAMRPRDKCVTVALVQQAIARWETQPRTVGAGLTAVNGAKPILKADSSVALSELAATLEREDDEVTIISASGARKNRRGLGIAAAVALIAGGAGWWGWQQLDLPDEVVLPEPETVIPPPTLSTEASPRTEIAMPQVQVPAPADSSPAPITETPAPTETTTVVTPPLVSPFGSTASVAPSVSTPTPESTDREVDNPTAVNPPSVVPPRLLLAPIGVPDATRSTTQSTLPFVIDHALRESSTEGVFVEERNAPRP